MFIARLMREAHGRMTGQPRRRVDALRNREAILAAARELVISRGPVAGMDEIAAAAGVAVGTLYRHFPTKKDLLDGIVTEMGAVIGRSLDEALARVGDGSASALDEIAALLRAVVIDMRQERLLRFAVSGLAEEPFREIQERGRVAVDLLVARAHEDGSLYPDITVDDIILLLSTSPDETVSRAGQFRWLALARRAITPLPVRRQAT